MSDGETGGHERRTERTGDVRGNEPPSAASGDARRGEDAGGDPGGEGSGGRGSDDRDSSVDASDVDPLLPGAAGLGAVGGVTGTLFARRAFSLTGPAAPTAALAFVLLVLGSYLAATDRDARTAAAAASVAVAAFGVALGGGTALGLV
jgi:hypothetical protein